jgi:hypothetical protein
MATLHGCVRVRLINCDVYTIVRLTQISPLFPICLLASGRLLLHSPHWIEMSYPCANMES